MGAPRGAAPFLRGLLSAVPFSFRGFFFFLLAAVLVVAGAARAELGALLSGAGLGVAILLSLAGVLAEGRRYRGILAGEPEALSIRLGEPSRDASGGLRCAVSLSNRNLPGPAAPGVFAAVSVRLEAGNGRKIRETLELPKAEARTDVRLPATAPLARGVYRGAAEIRIGDVFGFCSYRQTVARDLEVAACPSPAEPRESRIRGRGGERLEVSDRLVRGEDRFDSRPYLPGDDPRRIHWKQYARFGVLFIRPGDLSPPPRRAIRVLVDTERPGFLSGEAGEEYLDILASEALGFAERMKNLGRRVDCSASGFPDAPEDEGGLRRWFAALTWSDGAPGARNGGAEPWAMFGAPGGTRRRGPLSERRGGGRETLLCIPALPPEPRSSRMARLFLYPPPDGRIRIARSIRRAFEEALDRDLRELGGAGGIDVRIL